MSFAQDNGYTPVALPTIIEAFRVGINDQFQTEFTEETFPGSNWYRYLYALAQRLQQNEVKTSEIFQKLQQYILTTNERIQRPSVSFPGLIAAFASQGFTASVKEPIDADAGKISICVDVDDADPEYDATKLEICTLVKDFVAAGLVSQGTETESITLTNGQAFDFKFALPDRITVLLRLTLTKSENQMFTVPTDEVIREALFANVSARYRLGLNFEPQRYFDLSDAEWAGSVVLEWSDDNGSNYYTDIFEADFDELFEIDINDIAIVVS